MFSGWSSSCETLDVQECAGKRLRTVNPRSQADEENGPEQGQKWKEVDAVKILREHCQPFEQKFWPLPLVELAVIKLPSSREEVA